MANPTELNCSYGGESAWEYDFPLDPSVNWHPWIVGFDPEDREATRERLAERWQRCGGTSLSKLADFVADSRVCSAITLHGRQWVKLAGSYEGHLFVPADKGNASEADPGLTAFRDRSEIALFIEEFGGVSEEIPLATSHFAEVVLIYDSETFPELPQSESFQRLISDPSGNIAFVDQSGGFWWRVMPLSKMEKIADSMEEFVDEYIRQRRGSPVFFYEYPQ